VGTPLGVARRAVNALLGPVGFEVTRIASQREREEPGVVLPFRTTIAGAEAAGLSVSDFVEITYNRLGATQETLDAMEGLGVFENRIDRVCEIGPGSGRYLERTMKRCRPSHYEIYETAVSWAEWLGTTYGVTIQPTDGKTLAATPTDSIDLAQAHKVFVVTPSMTTCSYLLEMARVVRDGGKVVFDVVTEDCVDSRTLAAWLEAGSPWGPYPAMMPRRFVVDLLSRHRLALRGSFFVDMKPGRTECMVFVRGPQ
jgi:hypothetical protein